MESHNHVVELFQDARRRLISQEAPEFPEEDLLRAIRVNNVFSPEDTSALRASFYSLRDLYEEKASNNAVAYQALRNKLIDSFYGEDQMAGVTQGGPKSGWQDPSEVMGIVSSHVGGPDTGVLQPVGTKNSNMFQAGKYGRVINNRRSNYGSDVQGAEIERARYMAAQQLHRGVGSGLAVGTHSFTRPANFILQRRVAV